MSVPAQRQGRFPTVGSLIDHIFLVERRHLQRLMGQTPVVDQTGVVDTDVAGLFGFGDRARADLVRCARGLSEEAATTVRQFDVRGQRIAMTARKLLLNIFIHEIRHWAQVALAFHALSASNYRTVMGRRWREWDVVSETTAFADAA